MTYPPTEPIKISKDYVFTRNGFTVRDPQGRDVMKIAEREHFSVSRVAEELGLSIHQFKAALEKTVGLCPKEFFRHYRALLARWMISESIPLLDISEKLGFLYYTHFAAEIRSFYGISPRSLQRILQPAPEPKSAPSAGRPSTGRGVATVAPAVAPMSIRGAMNHK
jgi:AraC-like DNA-binding protein